MVPETGNYMILGYVVILGGMAAYVVSLLVRCRRLRDALAALEDKSGVPAAGKEL